MNHRRPFVGPHRSEFQQNYRLRMAAIVGYGMREEPSMIGSWSGWYPARLLPHWFLLTLGWIRQPKSNRIAPCARIEFASLLAECGSEKRQREWDKKRRPFYTTFVGFGFYNCYYFISVSLVFILHRESLIKSRRNNNNNNNKQHFKGEKRSPTFCGWESFWACGLVFLASTKPCRLEEKILSLIKKRVDSK